MRCSWAKSKEAIKYHDDQWCKETHDEIMLFKMLVLEGMQAGLSWDTILKKEEAYNQAYVESLKLEDKHQGMMVQMLVKRKLQALELAE